MSKCVCGMNPPSDPNWDCDRCMLIVENTRLINAMRLIADFKASTDDPTDPYLQIAKHSKLKAKMALLNYEAGWIAGIYSPFNNKEPQ
jgi:hypothetical protein